MFENSANQAAELEPKLEGEVTGASKVLKVPSSFVGTLKEY